MIDDTHGTRARAGELAGELRGIIEDLSTLEVGEEDLAAATRLARELREHLRGPKRPRWYDADREQGTKFSPSRKAERRSGASRASRIAYMDQSPIRGVFNPIAPPLRVEVVREPGQAEYVEGRVRLGQAYEGLADAAHGGWVAAIFDDMLGAAQGLLDAPGVTAILRTRFREVTPLGEELRFRAWIHEQRGRRIVIKGTCHAGETLTADAEGTFMRVDFSELRERMRRLKQSRSG